MPPPEPKSSTVSPGLSLASAVGLPQPSEAFRAPSGICPACASSYRFELIGSHEASAEPSQQEVCAQQSAGSPLPSMTRRAASPYFSLTISFTSIALSLGSVANLRDSLGLNRLVARAAFRIKEAQQLLQSFRIGGIPEVGAFAVHAHQVFVLELFEMVRKRRGRNVELRSDISGNQALGVR